MNPLVATAYERLSDALSKLQDTMTPEVLQEVSAAYAAYVEARCASPRRWWRVGSKRKERR